MSSHHVQTLANSIIGTAILAMPYCFSKCGVILSIVLLIVSTVVTRWCCHYLIKASIVTRRRNMEQLGFHMFGSAGKTMVELSVIGFLMGTCIAFYVVIGDLSPLIAGKIFNTQSFSHDSIRRFLIIAITIVCIIPLCFQKSIESLAFVCRASIGFYVCLTLKIVFESFERFESDSNWFSNISLWNFSGVLQCLPIFSMAMSCQMQLFEVYETMGHSSSFDRIKKTVHQATSICCAVYCIVGFFGYLAFYNQKLSGNVLINFRPSLANDAITIGFILSIACSFPLVIFPCRTALGSFLHRKNFHSELASHVPESKYKPLTLFIIFSTMVIGILIPSVEVIISLVGSTIGVLVCILFPATCFCRIMQRSSVEKSFAQIIIVIGFAIMIFGTYANLTAIDEAKSGSHLEEKVSNIEAIIEHPKDTHSDPKIGEVKLVSLKPIEDNVKKKSDEIEAKVEEPAAKKVDSFVEKVPEFKNIDLDDKKNEPEVEMLKPEVKLSKPEMKVTKPEVKSSGDTKPLDSPESDKKVDAKSSDQQEVKISDDSIKKEEQEMAADAKSETKDPLVQIQEKNEEIQELKESKDKLEKEVLEMKEELVKQNKETQQLVLQKFEEIAEKVDKIEKQSLDSAPSVKQEGNEELQKLLQAPIVDESKFIPKPVVNLTQNEVKNEAIPVVQAAHDDHLSNSIEGSQSKDLKELPIKNHIVNGVPVAQPASDDQPISEQKSSKQIETRVDPIVKLLKSQEPLSYQVGEKMMESRKANASTAVKVPESEPKPESSEFKNEMRRKRDTYAEALDSLDKTLQNFELKSMIGRDLKSVPSDET